MSRRHFAIYCRILLAVLVGVILWGAYVRATGSGAGCGSHWPLCNGEVIPRSPGAETIIEFTHRITSGVALLGGTGLVWFAFRLFPGGALVRRAAVVTLVLLLAEAVIGAGIVLFRLVGDDDSVARATLMAFHLVNTFLLLGAATVTNLAAAGLTPATRARRGRARPLILLCLLAVVVVGASGAVTALGDTLFPEPSFTHTIGRGLSSGGHFLVQLRILHPILALLTAALTLAAGWRASDEIPTGRFHRLPAAVVALVLAQTLAGALNIFLLAPVWLQLVHLLLADLLWISLVALLVVLGSRGSPPAPVAT